MFGQIKWNEELIKAKTVDNVFTIKMKNGAVLKKTLKHVFNDYLGPLQINIDTFTKTSDNLFLADDDKY
jgi:hypothetical protein